MGARDYVLEVEGEVDNNLWEDAWRRIAPAAPLPWYLYSPQREEPQPQADQTKVPW